MASKIDTKVWQEIDCLSCANCCKNMTPTFTKADVKRISAHLEMSAREFTEKWLVYEEEDKDWINKKQPCQFLSKENSYVQYL
jgi:Fe-S-cluster containining protein